MCPTLEFEHELSAAYPAAKYVFGFDEVGRGALAGPVMVGVAALKCPCDLDLLIPDNLKDSKLLTERRREQIFGSVADWTSGYAVGAATNCEIDEWGISHALGVAALRGLRELMGKLGLSSGGSECVGILDGPFDYITPARTALPLSSLPHDDFSAMRIPQIFTRVKADQSCAVVSAASVLAKVTRDGMMKRLACDEAYAVYGWDSNKGYGSAKHRAAIVECGPCDLHRLSWHLV
jgi:ribonuclease HII